MISDQAYNDYMDCILSQTDYWFFQFRLDHVRFFKGDCNLAAVLAYLLNLLKMKHSKPKEREILQENDLWFRCPAKQIEEHFGMTHRRRERIIKSLVDHKIIQTKHRKGNFLWIKVDANLLNEGREKPPFEKPRKGGSKKPRKGVTETPKGGLPIYTNNTSKNLSNNDGFAVGEKDFHSNGVHKKTKISKIAEELSDLLYVELNKVGKILRKPHLPSWEKEIKALIVDLRRRDDKKPSEILEYLKTSILTHVSHLNEQYWPGANSAKTFRDKFEQIEKAIQREEEKHYKTETIFEDERYRVDLEGGLHTYKYRKIPKVVRIPGEWVNGRFIPESESRTMGQ